MSARLMRHDGRIGDITRYAIATPRLDVMPIALLLLREGFRHTTPCRYAGAITTRCLLRCCYEIAMRAEMMRLC